MVHGRGWPVSCTLGATEPEDRWSLDSLWIKCTGTPAPPTWCHALRVTGSLTTLQGGKIFPGTKMWSQLSKAVVSRFVQEYRLKEVVGGELNI